MIYIVDNSIYSSFFFIHFFKFKFFNDPLKRNPGTATVWPTVIFYIKKWDFCIQLYVLYYVMLWIQLAPISSLNP